MCPDCITPQYQIFLSLNKEYFLICVLFLGSISKPEDFDQFISGKNENGKYACVLCAYNAVNKTDVRYHVESKHYPNHFSYNCQYCDHVLGTFIAMKRHVQAHHK